MTPLERFLHLHKKDFSDCSVDCEIKSDGMTLVLKRKELSVESFWTDNRVAIGNPPVFIAACQKQRIAEIMLSLFALSISAQDKQP